MQEPHPPPARAVRREPSTGLLVVGGPAAARDVPRLCARLRAIIATSDAAVVVCDVGALPATARTIEALARLALTAIRLGRRIRLQRATPELEQLVAFAGLDEVLLVV